MGLAKEKSKMKATARVTRKVRQTIADHRMLEYGDSVLIALSGGADSVVLAHVLHSLATEYGLRLAVAHLNHQLRDTESDRDADFVAEFSGKLALPYYIEKADVRHLQRESRFSLEEAAREARYAYFERIAAKNRFTKIATGHHANDNAELVLLNLMRGSGPLGLSGIRPIRDDNIIRPLIDLKRSEIMNYIDELKLPYVTDSSNSDLAFRRNRIRHHLIPDLESHYNPEIIAALNRLGNIIRAEDDWMDSLIKPEFNRCVVIEASDAVSIDLKCMAQLAFAVKRRLIRKAIFCVKKNLRRITLQHIDAVLCLADSGSSPSCLDLPDNICVTVAGGNELTIKKVFAGRSINSEDNSDPRGHDYQYFLSGPGVFHVEEANATIRLTEISMADLPDYTETGREMALLDMDSVHFPLVVRNMRAGDRFSPLGVNGTQKVKKYFNDHKIPRSWRRMCPLLICRDKIIWIAGHRIDNSVKLVSTTRRVLKAELLLA